MLYDDCFNPPPEPERVVTDWDEDLVIVKLGNYRLGLDATLEVLSETQMGMLQREELVGDLSRIVLGMEE